MLREYYYFRFVRDYIMDVNYGGITSIIMNLAKRKYIFQYYLCIKYIFLIYTYIYIYWYKVVQTYGFVNMYIYGKINFVGLKKTAIYMNYDLIFRKQCFLVKLRPTHGSKMYYRHKFVNINVVFKILYQVKILRREWGKIFSYRLNKYSLSLVYKLIYKKLRKDVLSYLFGWYLVLMGSKFIMDFRVCRMHEKFMIYNKLVHGINNNFYFVGLSKWYLLQ